MTRGPTKKFGVVAGFLQSFYRYTRTSLQILAAHMPLEIAARHRRFPGVPAKTSVRTHHLLGGRRATHRTRETIEAKRLDADAGKSFIQLTHDHSRFSACNS